MAQLLETLTPGQVFLVCIGALLAVAAAVNTLGSAVEKISKARNAAKAPNEAQDARLAALEEWRKDVDRKLKSDRDALDEINKGLRASYQAQLALLDHGIDGNNIQQMQDAKAELQQHLINR